MEMIRSLYRRVGDEPINDCEDQSPGESINTQLKTQDFSPKVHVLVGMLVPVMSTYTSWFGG
jgi:hypothetical protein